MNITNVHTLTKKREIQLKRNKIIRIQDRKSERESFSQRESERKRDWQRDRKRDREQTKKRNKPWAWIISPNNK